MANRASPRALHLDPEFINAPEDKTLGSEKLEHSVECFLENEEQCRIVLSEGQTTTVKSVPVAISFPAHLRSVPEVGSGLCKMVNVINRMGLKPTTEIAASGIHSNVKRICSF